MPHNIEQLLLNAGLLPSEVKVYLGALEMGPSSVQNIAKKTELSRTAVYEAVEMLEKRGLMSSISIGKKNAFSAEDPEKILGYLEGEKRRIESTKEDISRSLDAFRLLSGGIRPTVRVYEGEEALQAYFDHLAATKPKELSEITNVDDMYNFLDKNTLLSARSSYTFADVKRHRLLHRGKPRNPRPGVEFREISEQWGDLHGNIAIYENYVVFVTYIGKLVVVIMESASISASMQVLFNITWDACK